MSVRITWVGHATVLIEVDGYRVLTDPALTDRMVHLRRRVPAPALPPIDAVLVSHVHMDHLHLRSLHAVGPMPRLVVPDGSRRLVDGLGAGRLDEVRRGDDMLLGRGERGTPVSIEVVHAEHSCRRGPHSRITAPAVGYVVQVGEHRVYFAGDTDLFADMRHLGHVDVALLPIWGWGPTLGERHLDPASAAVAAQWIDAAHVVPIHWGTYHPITPRRGAPPWLDRPLATFRESLDGVGLGDRLRPLEPGGTYVVGR